MEKRCEFRFVFLLLAVVVTAFIWQQSTIPMKESAELSDGVRDVIVEAVGGEETTVGSFFNRFTRKIAHFVEFCLLGFCIGAYFWKRHTWRDLLCRLAVGVFVASMDEFWQLFTGRGASVLDVLLDLGGYVTALVSLVLAAALTTYIRTKRKGGAVSSHTA